MPIIFALIALLCPPAVADDWVEDRWSLGPTPRLQVYGTYDLSEFEPALRFFVESSGLGVDYYVANSRDLDVQIVQPQRKGVDVVFSSALDLQMKATNDGFAKRFAQPGDLQWRGALFQISLEPIVSVFNTDLIPWASNVTDRADLARRLRARTQGLPGGATLYDPQISGLGYLLSTQDSEQSDTFWELLAAFSEFGLSPQCCSSDMLKRVALGQSALAYNVLESYALDQVSFNPDLEILRFADYQLVVPRTAWVPRGSERSDEAFAFIEFLRGSGQQQLPLQNRLQQLSSEQRAPLKPIRLSPALILYLDDYKQRRFMRQWRRSTSAD